MAISIGAVADQFSLRSNGNTAVSPSGIVKLDVDEVTAKLKKDLIKSLNQELVKKVSDYELQGSVGLIITFSDDSLVSAYTRSGYANTMTYEQFKDSEVATNYKNELLANQSRVLDELLASGLVNEVRYSYVHIADGAFVKTTYDMIDKISEVAGVERIMISNRYLPADAVENPVDVYETGIFNSGSVTYTGKDTVVAILDTGCDYAHTAFTSYQISNPHYNRDMIAELLPTTEAYRFNVEYNESGLEAREVYYGNITGNKIAFGYDYADKDADIMPFDNSHGTHVAGIIAGKDDTITGVAVDAQLAIMKVFSDYDAGADEGDILAALEDSIILGVDAINMSLGASCGFTYESAPDKEYKNDVYSRIEEAGISLVVAASNDFSSGFGSANGNTNKTDNPDSATVGSPSTYSAAMSVASINGNKDNYMLANGQDVIFFTPSVDTSSKEYDFFAMLGITAGESAIYDYVTVPGVGMKINYSGIDVNGKIALVQRGDITFEEKVQFAAEAGAIAVIVYNNVFGDLTMTIGNDAKIPAVFIGKDEGDILAAQSTGTLKFDLANVAGPFMSDFSSWGPNPDLTLKPEITAHGGNIVSSVVGGEYDKMSGTSMAAPNMCGITVLIRQYVKESFPEIKDDPVAVRDLVNQLTMSTATIALDRKGNPYSPRKQGAGIADIAKSTTTPAYLYVDGLNKTKLELGDDPTRSGVYTMTVNLKNISDRALSYKLGNITMTESVSASDPEYVAEMAYLLSNTSEYSVEGGTLTDGVLTVNAGATAKVTVKITLSAADKSYLNATFKNGMYVEGYLTFDNMEENGVDLNAPFLAFYGDWGEAPIFDLDYYEVETEAHNNAIDDKDKIKADYYATTPLGSYYYDYILPLGSYVYSMDESKYTAIPATQDKAAISYYEDCISGIYGVFAGLLRGAKEMSIEIVDTSTGEVVWSETQYNCYKAHYNGSPYPYVANINLRGLEYDKKSGAITSVLGNNNTKFEVNMSAKLDWDGGSNASDTYSFSFYIDYEAPTIVDYKYRTEYSKSLKKNRYYLDLTVYDNHYAMSVRPIAVYKIINPETGVEELTYTTMSENPIPIYQQTRGSSSVVTIEITDYIDIVAGTEMSSGMTLYIDDYAMNSAICYVPFDETDGDDVEFQTPEIYIDINETVDLTTYFVHEDTNTPVSSDYFNTLKWYIYDDATKSLITEANENSAIALHRGQIEGLKTGTTKIMVTSDSWVTMIESSDGSTAVARPFYKELVVHVSDTVIEDNPNSANNALIEELKFLSFTTKFAFNSDIDFSEIGATGTTNYFDGNYSISCYPSEQVQLNYMLKPWNLAEERYTLSWTSSNPKVATVDENGLVTAEAKGNARITLKITIDGKTSPLQATMAVTVKSEFIVENRTLVAYKGKGGDVVIPDDEGIMYIGDFAFSHYDLDNEKEVEKDENGYYDMDEKKSAIGNNTVTSVVVPEGVEAINKYAFYNCTKLTDVILPASCKSIGQFAFSDSKLLKNVNFDNVKIVADYAFYNCASLSCEEIGGAKTEALYAVGNYGFANTRFTNLTLTRLSRIGIGAFANCSKLENVVLGKSTRIGEKMFMNTALTSVTVYSDSIADNAFENCQKLKTVVIANDLTYLGASAFKDCKELTSVTFNASVETIGDGAFMSCKKLTTLQLPDGKVNIGDSAFAMSALSTLKLSANTELNRVGQSIFDNIKNSVDVDVTASTIYTKVGSVVYTNDKDVLVLALPSNTVTSYTVPASVEKIASGAFSNLTKLKTVDFENGSALKYIDYAAFAGCTALTTVSLPANEIEIGDYAFIGDTYLADIDLSNVTAIGDYAFMKSGIKNANLKKASTIGDFAFYQTIYLQDAFLKDGAVLGEEAFAESSVKTVELEGDATLGYAAFYACTSLTYFDFEHVTGKLPDEAFYACTSLVSVNAPEITEIGDGAFSDCASLVEFKADKLTKVGYAAFVPMSASNKLTTLDLPSVTEIGDYAFYGCEKLETVNLPSLVNYVEGDETAKFGIWAFAYCTSLKNVTLGENVTEIPECTFYLCTSLASFDYSNIKTIGMGAFAATKLPETLTLENVEVIGEYAFVEIVEIDQNTKYGSNNVVTVNAPKATVIGDQAFAQASKLTTVNAPVLETLGTGAFAYTAIEEFEITSSLKTTGMNVFEGAESFRGFYATVNGEKVDTQDFENVAIGGGAIYNKTDKGYILTTYPMAKQDTEYTVLEGTTRIEFSAAYGNKYLEKVTLPSTLKTIGDFAFDGCTNLTTVVFRSYYAPVLEGSILGETPEVSYKTAADFVDFDLLYKYDYYYAAQGSVSTPFFYRNFKANVGYKDADGLVAILPDNCTGYDTLLYKAYFEISEETSGITAGKYAVDFMDAVNKLPANVDRFDKAVVTDAITAYNALMSHADEKQFVQDSYFAIFESARIAYNVDVVMDKINHLYDMDTLEYCFNAVKDAKAAYDALSAAEKALVTNASVLETKIQELNAVYGKEVDFNLPYADNVPAEQLPTETPPVKEGLAVWAIVLIIVGSVAVLAGGAAVTVILIRKKRTSV